MNLDPSITLAGHMVRLLSVQQAIDAVACSTFTARTVAYVAIDVRAKPRFVGRLIDHHFETRHVLFMHFLVIRKIAMGDIGFVCQECG